MKAYSKPSSNAIPLADSALLHQLERLAIHWHKSFGGLVGGHRTSKFSGAGQEFLEHRNFHPGDDLRSVKWRAYMRFERYFLKTFHTEPHVPIRILMDTSASMLAGCEPGGITKFAYAQKLAAALIYIGLVRLDSLVIQPFSDALLPPSTASGGRHQFQYAEAFLRQLSTAGRTDFSSVVRQFAESYPRPGLAMVISDFLAEDHLHRSLQTLADQGHELLLIQLWSPEDRQPQLRGEVRLVDSESGLGRTLSIGDAELAAYTSAFDSHAADLERTALRTGGRYVGIQTTTPLLEALFGPLRLNAAR